jgi:GntR family transcriptional repressor for pyruvate dehydrogenase complex
MGRPPKAPREQPRIARIENVDQSVSAEVIKALTTSFFAGGFEPGRRLPSERQLSDSLGVSRSAVRDAIQSLGLLGVLDIRRGDGTFISRSNELLPTVIEWGLFLGDQRLMDLVEARQLIEPELAGLAARRGTPAQVDDIRALLEQMRQADLPVSEYVELDVAFHLSIAAAAGNGALADVLRSITGLVRVWITRSLRAAQRLDTSTHEHELIYEAILAGDRRKATAAMKHHLNRAETRLRSTLSQEPAIGSPLPHLEASDDHTS